MSNTFAKINSSVEQDQKMPNFTLCEAFNPKATIGKWARQFLCIKNGMLAFGGSGAIALSLAEAGKSSPLYGKQCFEVFNCLLRTVEEYDGPPTRFNVLCFICAADFQVHSLAFIKAACFFFSSRCHQERYFSFQTKERCDIVYKVPAFAFGFIASNRYLLSRKSRM